MEDFIVKGNIYTHPSGTFRLRFRKGRAFEAELADRPGLWTSTGEKDLEKASAKVFGMLHSSNTYLPNERITFGMFADRFFVRTDKNSYRARLEKFGKAYDDDYFTARDSIMRNHIMPRWKDSDIRRIRSVDVEDWYIGITKQDGVLMASATRLRILSVMGIVMDNAVRAGIINDNPCDKAMKISPKKEKESGYFTIEEIHTLFPESRDELMRIWEGKLMWALFFSIMADTGFRPSEVLGLSEETISESGGVYTKESVKSSTRKLNKRIKTTDCGKTYKVGMLSSYTLSLLEEYRIGRKSTYLFEKSNGIFHNDNDVNYVLKKACANAGIDIGRRSPYGFRHAFDTNMLDKLGEQIESSADVQELMGHTGYRPEYDHRTPQMIIRRLEKIRPAIESIRSRNGNEAGRIEPQAKEM